MKKLFLITFLPFLLIYSCSTERSRLAKIDLKVEIERFDHDLFSVNEENFSEKIPLLQEKYGEFFEIFCNRVIEIGTPEAQEFETQLLTFLSDTVVQKGYQEAQKVFAKDKQLNDKLTMAFKRFKLHFPNDTVPQIYAYIAGFNQSVVLSDNVVGIGLDKYLGRDFPLYSQMGFYRYMMQNMYPAKLPCDIVRSFALGLFPGSGDNLLQKMIWEGKLLYFTKQMLPKEPDSCLFGFTPLQVKICLDNEPYMWNVLVGEQLLFSQQYKIIRDMTEEAPFSARFSQEAPGRAANFIGYRIVEQYMRRNREITLPQLMQNHNAQEILDGSHYNPN